MEYLHVDITSVTAGLDPGFTKHTVLYRTVVHWKSKIGSGSQVLNHHIIHGTKPISLYSDITAAAAHSLYTF